MGNDSGARKPFSAFCPPTEILMRACAGDLGDPYAEVVNQHLRGCRQCRMKVSAVCGLLKGAEPRRPVGHEAIETRRSESEQATTTSDWRRRAYNCGDPELQPRSHLVAARRLTLASVGDAPSHPTADYQVQIRPLNWAPELSREIVPIGADDFNDLANILRASCGPAGETVTVFLPAEAAWLVESFLFEDAGRWRVFITETTPHGQPRGPLTSCDDGPGSMPYRRVEASLAEGVRMSRWLFDKQNIPAGRLTGMTLAALGRVLGRGDADDLIPPDEPLLVVIPADDPSVDEDDLIDCGYGHLVSTP